MWVTKPLRNLQLNSGFIKYFMQLRSFENKLKNILRELCCLLKQLASRLTQIRTQSTLTTCSTSDISRQLQNASGWYLQKLSKYDDVAFRDSNYASHSPLH